MSLRTIWISTLWLGARPLPFEDLPLSNSADVSSYMSTGSKTTFRLGLQPFSSFLMTEHSSTLSQPILFINTENVSITTRVTLLSSTRQRVRGRSNRRGSTRVNCNTGNTCKLSSIDGDVSPTFFHRTLSNDTHARRHFQTTPLVLLKLK